ncbi:MAG: peptide-methionine (R)-S-oxide reductase MsrB [Pseudomonadota bacterium]
MVKITKTDAQWRQELSDISYTVTRKSGTERPFTGLYHDCKDTGIYHCICCNAPLFDSQNKFDSGTGWPSFDRPKHEDALEEKSDYKLFLRRTEVVCSNCGAHLGHVFNDGPQETTGLRYCINSAALNLKKTDS